MKNARVTAYTPDAIREAGEIIAAAILQGGGSGSVSWEQIVLTGTKIAEITINGEVTEVYAPDPDAADIDYDNSTSGLVATNVQAAIDEVYAETSTNTGDISDLNTEVGAHDTAIGNLQTAVASKANESIIAPVEASLTASRAYAIGEQFIYSGTLYTATAAITAGGTIVINGNCTASDTVTEQIQNIKQGESVSVTADGVKTYQQVLNSLFALLDTTKITYNSYMKYGNYIYRLTLIMTGLYQFTVASIASSNTFIQKISVSASSGCERMSGSTFTDLTSQVPTNGATFTIYY